MKVFNIVLWILGALIMGVPNFNFHEVKLLVNAISFF